MSKKKASNKSKETEAKAPDTTLTTKIVADEPVVMGGATKEPVAVAKEAAKVADVVTKGDVPPRKLKDGEVYLGKGTIMENR